MTSLPQPLVAMFVNELVVIQVRIGAIYTVDLFELAETENLFTVEAPGALEQALAAQYLVKARDAASVFIGRIEEG